MIKKSIQEDIMIDNQRVIRDDFISTKLIKNDSIDLIVTSPPYNLNIGYGNHDDGKSYKEYLKFVEKWLRKAYNLSKNDGRFCLNVPLDKNKGGHQSVCADYTSIAKNVGWQYFSTIIWNEGNISRRTAWGSFMSASAPHVIAPVEVIIVFYKKDWKKYEKGVSTISKKEFIDWTNGLWVFNGERKKRFNHPAPFPVDLPLRCIKLFSREGDVVLDPFVGSGTTLVASKLTNRRGIGVDIDVNYIKTSIDRIKSI